jgi:hypothetical protein
MIPLPLRRGRLDGRRMRTLASASLLAWVGGCGPGAGADKVARDSAAADLHWECGITQPEVPLLGNVHEASGAALDPRTRGVMWTHGDSGQEPVLYALGANGRLLGRVHVAGAKNRDWEDMAIGPCPGGSCVYVGDIGNNNGRGEDLVLYRAPIPALNDARTQPAQEFRARYPDHGRDTEAMFVTPEGEVYLVNKGRQDPVELWRWPTPLRPGPVLLERVREIGPRVRQVGDLVTGAGMSPDGRWVAVRTYGRLVLYRAADLLGGGAPAFTMDLAPLGEAWGEGVAMSADGTVLLVSEGRAHITGSQAAWLKCALPPA